MAGVQLGNHFLSALQFEFLDVAVAEEEVHSFVACVVTSIGQLLVDKDSVHTPIL